MTRALAAFCLVALAFGADQTRPGPGNHSAEEIAHRSQRVEDALALIRRAGLQIKSDTVRKLTLDALEPTTCVAHRAGLTSQDKSRIIDTLVSQGLADPADDSKFPGGLAAGIFPPIPGEGGTCPALPQRFDAAPGSTFVGHHSYPGGLAIHEAFNLSSSRNFASLYRDRYGPNAPIDEDIIIAAPIWHDWAKTLVFQWNADGSEFEELNFGGSSKVESKTGAHHIIGLAEAMKRGLPAEVVIAQASAHAAPVLGNEYKVVNWIRAASIIARVDPVTRGYLVQISGGDFKIPAYRVEYGIHNMSDADFVVSIPAAARAVELLVRLAPEFGVDPADKASFNLRFRNRVLSRVTAERILLLYTSGGLDRVRSEIKLALR